MLGLRTHKFRLLWILVGIPIISVWVLGKTFNLGLYGDDWLQLYNIWLSFDVHKQLSFFDIRSYLGAYWPQYFFLGIIRHFFGYQPQAYFASSLFLRILATISIFLFSYQLSKSRLMAFLSSLIYIFTVAGLETTDWVFNMNTYAGIFFFNLSAIFYLKTRQCITFFSWHYLAFAVSFLLALGIVPVRMHGAILFLVLTELFLLSLNKKRQNNKLFFVRLLLPVLLMALLIKIGSFGSPGDNMPLFSASFTYLQNMLARGRFDVLFSYLGIIGNLAIPDIANVAVAFNRIFPLAVISTTTGLLFSFAVKAGKTGYILVIIVNIIWAAICKTLTLSNPGLSFYNLFSITVGFQVIFLSLLIFYQKSKHYPYLSLSIIVSLFYIISFTLIYWPRTGFMILESTSRYMTVGAAGFSMLMAAILSIMIKSYSSSSLSSPKARIIKVVMLIVPVIVFLYWININFASSKLYLNALEYNRNIKLVNKTWNSLKSHVPKLEENVPSVFYFTYDNPTATYMVLTFGFWPHAGLMYNITKMENTPIPTDNYNELLEMTRTGGPLKRIHSRIEAAVPLSRVFAFDFKQGELINITENIRQKLMQDLQKDP